MEGGYPSRREEWFWRDIGGEIAIVNEDGLETRVLNATAALVWTMADGSHGAGEIVAATCERFDVGPEQARADVEAFLGELVDAGMVDMLADAADLTT